MGHLTNPDGTYRPISRWIHVRHERLIPITTPARPGYPGRNSLPVIVHGNRALEANVAEVLAFLAQLTPDVYMEVVEYLPKIEWLPQKFAARSTAADSTGAFAIDGSDNPRHAPHHGFDNLFRSILHETGHNYDPHLSDPDAHVGTYPDQPVEFRAEWYQNTRTAAYNEAAERWNDKPVAIATERRPGRELVAAGLSNQTMIAIASAWKTSGTPISPYHQPLQRLCDGWAMTIQRGG